MVKSELKIQTQQPKQMISSSSSSSSSSCTKKKYKGVRMRSWGSWVSEIRAPNQKTRIWLGSYPTAEAAARAYDAALLCLKGPSANLNFPITSSHYIPTDTILSPKSIQRVAAAAANSVVDSATATATAAASTTTAATPPISPPPPSTPSSSISSVSSPSIASSPTSDHVDDGVSLIQSLVANDNHDPVSMMEPWYSSLDDSLQFPKFFYQMFNVPPFDPPTLIDEFYEEDDIRLWSFC